MADEKDGDISTSPLPAHPTNRPLHRMHLWQIQAVRDLLFIGALITIIWLGYALRAVTIPLLVALLLAYLFEPVIERLIRHPRLHLTRVQAVLALLITIVGMLLVILALIVPLAVGQTAKLVSNFNDGTMRAQAARLHTAVPDGLDDEFESFLHLFPQGRARDRFVRSDLDDVEEGTTQTPPAGADAPGGDAGPPVEGQSTPPLTEARIREIVAAEVAAAQAAVRAEESRDLLAIGQRGLETVLKVLGAVAAIGLLLFLIPFYFFFFSMSYPRVVRFFRQLIPEKNKARTLELIGKMDRVVSAFVRGRIVIAALMGLMLAAGWILCGVPYAIVLGIVAGVFSLVPYLVGVALPLAIALLFFEQLGLPPEQRGIWLGMFGVFLWPTVVYLIVQFIETYILTPKIAGKAANLDPVTVVVAVLAGGSLLGVYGMLLAIPIAACVKIIITDVLAPRINQWLRGERPDPLPIEVGE